MVDLYDVVLKPGYSTDNVAVIATGLPAEAYSVHTSVPSHNISDEKILQMRIKILDRGILKPWFVGLSTDAAITGTFVYIADS